MIAFLFCLVTISPDIDAIQKLVELGDHEAALVALSQYKPTQETKVKYCFLMAATAFMTNQKDVAAKWLLNIENSFEPVPERYAALARIMSAELKEWKQDDIDDIGRDMRIVQDRLYVGKGGKKTQKVQQQIVDKFDKMIKEKEEELKKQQQMSAQPQPSQGSKPMEQSMPATDSGPGKVDQKKLQHLTQNWGKLPEKERAKAMQEIVRDLPPRYREVIEDYFKALAKNNPK